MPGSQKGKAKYLKRKRRDDEVRQPTSPTPLKFAALQRLAEENYNRDRLEYQSKRPRRYLQNALKKVNLFEAESSVKYHQSYTDLRRYARGGGPDMSDLKEKDIFGNYRKPKRDNPMVPVLTEVTPRSRISAHTGPELIIANLAAQGIKLDNILSYETAKAQEDKLQNYKEIMDSLSTPRDIKDVPEERCQATLVKIRRHPLEKPFCDGMMPILAGKPDSDLVRLAQNEDWVLFSPAGPLTIYDSEVLYSEASKMEALLDKDPRADFAWGSHPSLVHSQIREDPGDILAPMSIKRYQSPGAINLVFKAGRQDENERALAAQVLMAGALSARIMYEIRSWRSDIGKSELDGRAYCLAFTFDPRAVIIYACRPCQTLVSDRIGYTIVRLKSFLISDDSHEIIDAARYIRNAIDLTTKWRLEAIAAANSRAIALGYVNKPFNKSGVPDVLYHEGWSRDDFQQWFKQSRSREQEVQKKRAHRALRKAAASTSLVENVPSESTTASTIQLEDHNRPISEDGKEVPAADVGYRTVPSLRAKSPVSRRAQRDENHWDELVLEIQPYEKSDLTRLSQRSVVAVEVAPVEAGESAEPENDGPVEKKQKTSANKAEPSTHSNVSLKVQTGA